MEARGLRRLAGALCAGVFVLSGRAEPSSGRTDPWAVAEGKDATGSGLYMVSGDVMPDGANAIVEKRQRQLDAIDKLNRTVVSDYVTGKREVLR